MTLESKPTLVAIPIEACWDPPPPEYLRTIEIANEMLSDRKARGTARIPLLVNSNYYIAYHALRQILDEDMAGNGRFCEWGSGLGVVACLAAQIGFQVTGIEIEASLCAFARELADRCGVDATFHAASYRDVGEIPNVNRIELPFPIGDIRSDVIYVYPWPAEEPFVESLFEKMQSESSRLISYHGGVKLRARRYSPPKHPS